MNKLQALIFDVDGTLANTERDGHRVAFNKAFAQRGLDWNWSEDFYGELLVVTGGKERIQYYIDRYKPELPDDVDDVEQFVFDVHEVKNKYYQELLQQASISLRPGVKRLITEAKENGLRLAIATTSAIPNTMAVLRSFLDPDWFEVVAAGDMVQEKKPAPDIYYYALEKMNLPPQNCLVIEDSLHGMEAAVTAGIKTIVTVNNYTKGQDFSQAALVVSHLGEPDNPIEVIQGKSIDKGFIDLDTVIKLFD